MLDHVDMKKFMVPLLVLFISKTALFVVIIALLAAKNMVGLNLENIQFSACDDYMNFKISNFRNKIDTAQFILALVGSFCSSLGLFTYLGHFLHIKKNLEEILKEGKKFSENHLTFHFALSFIEGIVAFHILGRSISHIKQCAFCKISIDSTFIILLCLSGLLLTILIYTKWLFFKLLEKIKGKIKILEELNFYTNQMTLRQNLFFNKQGYIKEILKMQNYTSHSSMLKQEVITNFPSGYKIKQLSPKRQITYRLLGGKDEKTKKKTNNKPVKQAKQQQVQIQFQNQDINSKTNNEQQDDEKFEIQPQLTKTQQKNEEKQMKKIGLLEVNQKRYEPNPNDQNYQRVELTLNVLQISVNDEFDSFKQQSTLQQQFNTAESKEKLKNEKMKGRRLLFDSAGSDGKGDNHSAPKQFNQEQQLRQRFHLTYNEQGRRKYEKKKNFQHLDEHGKYFYIDVDRIKKKTKFLSKNSMNDNQCQQIASYLTKQWTPKQERIGKVHERNVQEYLKQMQKIRKEQMLINQEPESFDSDSFESSSLSSEISQDSDNNQNILNPTSSLAVGQAHLQKLERQNEKLILHLKRKKISGAENKLKLFEDQEGFYDSQGDEDQKADLENMMRMDFNQQNGQLNDKNTLREGQKSKIDEKFYLRNKQLQTSEARMLRFIRHKYIAHQTSRRQHNQTFIQTMPNYESPSEIPKSPIEQTFTN